MIELHSYQIVKKNNFRLILFIFLGLFISENGFAPKAWYRELMAVTMDAAQNSIAIAAEVYDYSIGPNSEHAFLKYCKLEASYDNRKYFRLMEILTTRQNKSNSTKVIFKNKLLGAKIVFYNDIFLSQETLFWSTALSSYIEIMAPNYGNESVVGLNWRFENKFKNVRYIRICGIWQADFMRPQYFYDEVYDFRIPNQNLLKTNTPAGNKEKTEKM